MGNGTTKTLTTSPDQLGMVHRVVVDDDVIARGKRKFVCPARLIGSWRGGDIVVVKVLDKSVPDEEYWLEEIDKCNKLREHVIAYRKAVKLPLKVHVEYPMTAYIDKVSKWMKKKIELKVGEFVLVEEKLGDKYSVFMTSFGTLDSQTPSSVSDVLRELMHFTYHESCRKQVFCGFQGSFSDGLLSLSEPTVHSVNNMYRDTDEGMEGILIAFDNHRCTARCKDWLKPEDTILKQPNGNVVANRHIAPVSLSAPKSHADPRSHTSSKIHTEPRLHTSSNRHTSPNGHTNPKIHTESKLPTSSDNYTAPKSHSAPKSHIYSNGQIVSSSDAASNGITTPESHTPFNSDSHASSDTPFNSDTPSNSHTTPSGHIVVHDREVPNDHIVSNGYRVANVHIVPIVPSVPNGYKVTNGHVAAHGHVVTNGHKVVNGHIIANGHVIGSISTTV